MANFWPLRFLVALSVIAAGSVLSVSAIAKTASDFSAAWQGKWSWASKPDAGGSMTISACRQNTCTVHIMSGDISSVCESGAADTLQLLGKSKAIALVAQERYGGSNYIGQRCKLTLTNKNGRISIDNEAGEACNSLCGHGGADFGTNYRGAK